MSQLTENWYRRGYDDGKTAAEREWRDALAGALEALNDVVRARDIKEARNIASTAMAKVKGEV